MEWEIAGITHFIEEFHQTVSMHQDFSNCVLQNWTKAFSGTIQTSANHNTRRVEKFQMILDYYQNHKAANQQNHYREEPWCFLFSSCQPE